MMDVQVGKNKYKVTLTILIGAFTILVSSIGWVLSLQMSVAATEKDIAELNDILKEMGKDGYGDKREYGNYD